VHLGVMNAPSTLKSSIVNHGTRSRWTALLLCLTLALGWADTPVSAAPLYENSFTGDTGYGTLPADWSAVAFTQQSSTGGLVSDTFRINPAESTSTNTPFRAFALADSVGGNWDNYTVTTAFRLTSQNSSVPVLFGRWNEATYSGTTGSVGGYALALSDYGRLFTLVKNPGNTIRESEANGLVTLDSALLTSFMPGGVNRVSLNTWYTFELTMNGSNLTGRFYQGTDTTGTLLHTLTATDTTYTKGSVGLGAAFGGDTSRTVQFDYIQVIPEPSTYALLGLAAAGLAGHVIRRRRRS
jgi:hypothetical protein